VNIDQEGWLSDVSRCCSPNYNERPDEAMISLLVIHNISLPPGQFGGGYIHDFFTNQLNPGGDPFFTEIADMQVSAHLLIERTGTVTQFVPFAKRAWHAGRSCFQQRENCNDFSIGIELEGTDAEPYTDEQYQTLSTITHVLMGHYPALVAQNIVGHSDIAPGRKTDPGPSFDWERYRLLLNKIV